jgi:hypothetical protein
LILKQPGKTAEYLHAIADCPTCWNSFYLAWRRLLKLKKHINMLLNILNSKNDRESKKDYKNLQKIMLSEEEWNTIKKLIPVLRPFAEATELLGGSTYCTHLMMIPILIDIKKKLTPKSRRSIDVTATLDFSNSETVFDEDILNEEDLTKQSYLNDPVDCDGLVSTIKKTLYNAIDHYWKDIATPESLLPSLLDPHMKNLSFVSARNWFAAEELLREKFNEMKDELDQELDTTTTSDTTTNRQPKKKAKKTKQFTVLANLKKSQTPISDEIEEYLKLEEIDLDDSCSTWWYEKREKFPVLSRLAKKYLAVYACSTASERLFSDAGNLLTVKRA